MAKMAIFGQKRAKKGPFWPFWPKIVKNGLFWPFFAKNAKNGLFWPFLALFWGQKGPFLTCKVPSAGFDPFLSKNRVLTPPFRILCFWTPKHARELQFAHFRSHFSKI